MRRLQHLARVEWMRVGIVVMHASRGVEQDDPQALDVGRLSGIWQVRERGIKLGDRFLQKSQRLSFQHFESQNPAFQPVIGPPRKSYYFRGTNGDSRRQES